MVDICVQPEGLEVVCGRLGLIIDLPHLMVNYIVPVDVDINIDDAHVVSGLLKLEEKILHE